MTNRRPSDIRFALPVSPEKSYLFIIMGTAAPLQWVVVKATCQDADILYLGADYLVEFAPIFMRRRDY